MSAIIQAGPVEKLTQEPLPSGDSCVLVRFGGDAFTQGVINTRVDGVPIRVYSLAKTVADCLKYRKRIRLDLAQQVLEECVASRKCSSERLRQFAKICRVTKLVQAAYSLRPQTVVQRGRERFNLS